MLRALAWDHPRCLEPMRACSAAWEKLHPALRVVWDVRSLERFEDEPLDQVAAHYDLLTVDHPLCGRAHESNALRPIDELVSPAQLAVIAADAVGPSFASYTYAGRQWALPVDGACQVAAVREDLLGSGPVPTTWDDVVALASERPGTVALPLAPAHALSTFLSYCTSHRAGVAVSAERLVDAEVGVAALDWLAAMAQVGPQEAIRWGPPELLARMTSSDAIAYVPAIYGYVTYAWQRVPRPCRFVDLPRADHGSIGSVLGGAGLAVTRSSRFSAEAAAFAAWVASPETQRTIVAPAGGQPSSRAAWLDPDNDRRVNGFFSGTLATIEAAWVRPRDAWWPAFQREGGRWLVDALERRRRSSEAFGALEALYRGVRSGPS